MIGLRDARVAGRLAARRPSSRLNYLHESSVTEGVCVWGVVGTPCAVNVEVCVRSQVFGFGVLGALVKVCIIFAVFVLWWA